ncbi:MAG: amidohydrolase [Clostridiales bacterium]|nr:amidohydrolase [Clostridiales bacterium]
MNILIKNVHVITGDANNIYIGINNIAIKDDLIYYIGKKIPENFIPNKVIEGKESIAMPGLVNAHTHTMMVLMRNSADDLTLENWLHKNILPKEKNITRDIVKSGTMLGIAEMIKSGTTCFLDMYYEMDVVAKAVLDSGMRANLSYGLMTCNQWQKGHEYAKAFCKDFHNEYNLANDGKLKTSVEAHSVYLCDETMLRANATLARELNSSIHIHLHETKFEVEESIIKTGLTPIKQCLKTGVFDVPVIAAHTIWVDDDDMMILKEKNVTSVHNPSSNLKLASGIARVPDMLDLDINVAIGTDGAASNNMVDMFNEMRLASLIHKGSTLDPTVVNAATTIQMATYNGAKALGFENLGLLKEGMKADLILVDTSCLNNIPLNNPASAIVYSSQGSNVDTVICNGDILMEHRELLTIDEEKTIYEARNAAKKL